MAATRTKSTSKAKPRGGRTARKPPPTRARRSLLASRPSLRPALNLEPHHLDIIALALIAVGIFLSGVAYLGWGGGALGNGALSTLRFLFGAVAYAVPVAVLIAGGLMLARDIRPPARPLRTGALCLTFAVTLALAAGTLGIGPGPTPPGSSGTARRSRAGVGSSGRSSTTWRSVCSRRPARTSSPSS